MITHVANRFETTLSDAMGPTDLEAKVISTAGGPASPAYLMIEPDDPEQVEIILFDGTFDATTFRASHVSSRYRAGSASGAGLTHPVGSKVISGPLAQIISDLHSRITNAIPAGIIAAWSGTIATIPTGWVLCDGTNGTPDLRGRFIVGAGGGYTVGDTGGANSVTLSVAQVPPHSHNIASHTHSVANHNHGGSTGSVGNHTHGSGSYAAQSSTHSHVYGDVDATSDSNHTHPASGTSIASGPSTSVDAPNRTWTGGSHTHNVSGSSSAGGGHNHTIPTQTGLSTGGSGTLTTNNTGSGAAHENRPPYYALAFIMKVAT